MFDQEILDLDPWQGEYESDRVVQDRFVSTRKLHFCAWCESAIGANTRVRARSQVNRELGAALTAYFCGECSQALKDATSTGCIDLYFRRYQTHGVGVFCETAQPQGQAAVGDVSPPPSGGLQP